MCILLQSSLDETVDFFDPDTHYHLFVDFSPMQVRVFCGTRMYADFHTRESHYVYHVRRWGGGCGGGEGMCHHR